MTNRKSRKVKKLDGDLGRTMDGHLERKREIFRKR